MKLFRPILMAACMTLVSQAAIAQYSFHLDVSVHGKCTGSSASSMKQQIQSLCNMINAEIKAIPMSKQECLLMRSLSIGEVTMKFQLVDASNHSHVYEEWDCTISVTASPCSGRDLLSNDIILGPGQGSSFFSSNPADEINNWSSDDVNRHLALDQKKPTDHYWLNPSSTSIETGYPEYNKVRTQIRENGMLLTPLDDGSYLIGQEMTSDMWSEILRKELYDDLHVKYLRETGVNIMSILKKDRDSLSAEEWAILNDYFQWKISQLQEAKMVKNMAVSSALAYADGDMSLLKYSDFKFVNSTDVSPDNPMYRLVKMIELCNNDENNQGFHANVFFDESTGTYAVAFRGTEDVNVSEVLQYLMKEFAKESVIETSKELAIDAALAIVTGGMTTGKLVEGISESQVKAAISVIEDLIKDLAEGNTEKLPPSLHDWATDASQALGMVLTQYKMAVEIGDIIRQLKEQYPDLKIVITGHSMGGGLGITAGTISGQPTYVFNPAGVHSNVYKYAKSQDVNIAGNDNIQIFSEKNDFLTSAQEMSNSVGAITNTAATVLGHVATGNDVELPEARGDKHVITAHAENIHDGGIIDRTIGPLLDQFSAHSMEPMAYYYIHRYEDMKDASESNEDNNIVNIYYE